MRVLATALAAITLLLQALPASAQGLPPHAFLFGTWTGGLFPVPPGVSREACFSQPVVIFTRDLVMRATLTEQTLTQREIETVRATPAGFEFRLVSAAAAASPILGSTTRSLAGFGCSSADALVVQRRGENEIAFPGCADFPNPLVRCR